MKPFAFYREKPGNSKASAGEPMERPLEEKILQLIRDMPNCTYDALAESLGVLRSTVKRTIKLLTEQDKIARIGGKRYGCWVIHE